MGVDEVSKLRVGNGFIRILSESGEVGAEFLELAIKVGGGFKETCETWWRSGGAHCGCFWHAFGGRELGQELRTWACAA